MADENAWVTLATNDAYSLGALVLAHSLQRVSTKYPTVVLITPSVTPIMIERLSSVFSQVVTVDVLDSKDAAHLALLARPELGITFTKLHCWRLTQYKKCVFLDADTLVFQNCDELFEREEFSAAPDVGWPDCFNSGVFVYQPSNETFDALVKFAQEKGSFDGGDQGLLNSFFSNWARGDINKHLPFLYNVCSTAFYSYLPALKQFGGETKIMHFIGQLKPWLQKFNWASRTVDDNSYLQAPLQYWWNIFLEKVHPTLDVAMVRWECGASNEARYSPPQNDHSQFPWHHPTPPPELEQPSSAVPHTADYYDPWDSFTPAPAEAPPTPPSSCCSVLSDSHNTNTTELQSNSNNCDPPQIYQSIPWYEIPEYTSNDEDKNEFRSNQNDDGSQVPCGPGGSHCGTVSYNFDFNHLEKDLIENWESFNNESEKGDLESICNSVEHQEKVYIEEVRPRHPYDNYYLNHTIVLDRKGCKRCSHEDMPPDPSPSPTPSTDTEPDLQAGIAGALSQMTLGESEQGSCVEEHLRRQGWEAGNIDYMGADSFSNIWAKISQTLSNPPQQSAPPPVQEAPVVVPPEVCPIAPTPEVCPIVAPRPEVCQVVAPLPEVCPMVPPPVAVCPIVPPPVAVCPIKPPESCPLPEKPVEPIAKAPEAPVPTEETPSAPVQEEPQAIKEEKQDIEHTTSFVTEIPTTEVQPPKPPEKLLCHLTPTQGVDPLLTPEFENEDSASIALSIIASEMLPSPTVTSPTSPPPPAVCSAVPQNVRDLCIDTSIPDTPPVPGPVSLAQIGIIPSRQISEKAESTTSQKEIITSKPVKDIAAFPEKTLADKNVTIDKTETIVQKAVCPVKEESTKKQVEALSDLSAKKLEAQSDNTKQAKSTSESSKGVSLEPLKIESKPSSDEKVATPKTDEPATPTKEIKGKKVKKLQPAVPKSDSKPSTPEPPKTPPNTTEPLACSMPEKLEPAKVEAPTTPTATPSPTAEKKDSAPTSTTEPAAKPKRIAKKPTPAKPKSDTPEDVEPKLDTESPKKSEEMPVPPPRKKEKKPKEKK